MAPLRLRGRGAHYNCAEQYMMAEKASLFEDWKSREEILRAGTPREQKALGRRVAGFEEDAWQARCLDIVAEATTTSSCRTRT